MKIENIESAIYFLQRVVGSFGFTADPTDCGLLAYLFGSLFVVTLIVGSLPVALCLSF